jgi:TIR domain
VTAFLQSPGVAVRVAKSAKLRCRVHRPLATNRNNPPGTDSPTIIIESARSWCSSVEEFDVFLSHQSGDKPWVIALKAALVERGVKVWLDQDEIRPGDLFIDALEQGVQACRCVAVVASPESLRSAWVKEEYQRALVLSSSGS